MQEMTKRGYRVSPEWLDKEYRGKQMPAYDKLEVEKLPCHLFTGMSGQSQAKRNHHLKEENDEFV